MVLPCDILWIYPGITWKNSKLSLRQDVKSTDSSYVWMVCEFCMQHTISVDHFSTSWWTPVRLHHLIRIWSAVCEFIVWGELCLMISDSCIAAVPFGTTDVLGTSFLERLPWIAFLISNDFASRLVSKVSLRNWLSFTCKKEDMISSMNWNNISALYSVGQKRFPCPFWQQMFPSAFGGLYEYMAFDGKPFWATQTFWHMFIH